MPPSPTIRDIAEKLGLGKSTVQRALSGRGYVAPARRKRVLEVARQIGYHPNPLFSTLARQRALPRRERLDIAYIHAPSTRAGAIPFEAVAEAADSLGYRANRITPSDAHGGPRLMNVLYHRGYAGAIIGPVRASLHATLLNNLHLPVVCCGRIDQLPLHTVQPDITDNFRTVWKHVAAAGYRRIGAAICLHFPPIEDDLDRLGACASCQRDIPDADRVPPLQAPLRDQAALLDWYHRHRPDAVIGFSVSQYYYLRDAGVDMDRVGFATLHLNPRTDPTLCGMDETNEKVARETVHMLDQFIRRRASGIPDTPLHLLIPGCWHEGKTLCSPPPAGKRPRPAKKTAAARKG